MMKTTEVEEVGVMALVYEMVLAHRIGFFLVLNLRRKKAIVDIFDALFVPLPVRRKRRASSRGLYDMLRHGRIWSSSTYEF
jgi:hypothetical protein